MNVEIIGEIQGSALILGTNVNTDIPCLAILLKDEVNMDIPSTINIIQGNYGVEFKASIMVDWTTSKYDLLEGTATLNKSTLMGDILYGNLEYETGRYENGELLSGSLFIAGNTYRKNLIFGDTIINRDEVLYGIDGELNYEQDILRKDVLYGKGKIEKSVTYITLLDGDVTLENEEYSNDLIDGNLDYEQDNKVKDLYGKANIEGIDVKADLFKGTLDYEIGESKTDVLVGKAKVDNNLHSSYLFGCAFVPKRREHHSFYAGIRIPHSVNMDIASRVVVDPTNYYKQDILEGNALLYREGYTTDLIEGTMELLNTPYYDIDGEAYIEPVYTRREFDSSLYVVSGYSHEFDAMVNVKDPIPVEYETCINSSIIVGEKYNSYIDSSIVVEPNPNPGSGIITNAKGCRIGIVVSPTWKYEPFVFKSCLVTLLDKYYRKLDLDIVFGGNPRSDFDIINLANNYRIRGNHLLQVPIKYDFKNKYHTMVSVDHFIDHLALKKEGYPLSRVFIFMNQPGWYYNDPVGKIAAWCKANEVSCVGIDSGGEFQEILDRDKVMDAINRSAEHERHMRMHPRYKIENHRLPNVDPREIVY